MKIYDVTLFHGSDGINGFIVLAINSKQAIKKAKNAIIELGLSLDRPRRFTASVAPFTEDGVLAG